MFEGIVFVLWLLIIISCMIIYHKIFDVFYFGNIGKSLIKELVGCSLVATILLGLAVSCWWIIDILLVIVIVLLNRKNDGIKVFCIGILMALITIVGLVVK